MTNNPVMYINPTGEALIGFLIGLIITAIVVDTVVETTILLTSDEYKAKNVFNGKTVEIPNSAFFNNPIAQYFYADYLYENVKYDDGTRFFTGDVYDIIGEWQAHNMAYGAVTCVFGYGVASQIEFAEKAKILIWEKA